MSRELFCTICSRFVDVDGLQLVRDFTRGGSHKGKGRGLVATFLDRKTGTAHVVLTERQSEKFRPKASPEPEAIVAKPEPSRPAPTPPVEAPSPPELREQWQTEAEQETAKEAEALWNSEVQPWEPQPDEWYQGRIFRVFTGYSLASLSNGQVVFISENVVIPERGHTCLRSGDSVALRLEKNNGGTANHDAVECELETPRVLSDEETGIIEKATETGKSYFVWLSCGCYTRALADDFDPLYPGEQVVLSDFVADKIKQDRVIARKIRRQK